MADIWRKIGEANVLALTTEIHRRSKEAVDARAAADAEVDQAAIDEHLEQAEWCEMVVEICRARRSKMEDRLAR